MSEVQVKMSEIYTQLLKPVPGKPLRLMSKRYIIVYGGRRAGKSYDIQGINALTILYEPGHRIYSLRKVGTSVKDSIYSRFYSFYSEHGFLASKKVRVNKTDKEFTVEHSEGGNSTIRCLGMDDPEKLKSLDGVTRIHLEEATEFTELDFDSLDTGLSPNNHFATIILTHNPVPSIPGELHWIQKRFLNRVPHKMGEIAYGDDCAILKVNYKNNAFCPEANKKGLERYKKTNMLLYKMWVLAEFSQVEGAIFPDYKKVSKVPDGMEFLGYGQDYGFANDPAALLEVWKNKECICIKGVVYSTGLQNKLLVELMKEAGVQCNDDIIADSSDPKTIEYIREYFQYIVGVVKAKNYKSDVIRVIKDYTLLVVEDDSQESIHLQNELGTYHWDTTKEGIFKNKPADGNDHFMDCFIMVCKEKLSNYEYREITAGY